ncbi:flagellar hook-length control protein FliK [Marinospirillum insulare]|uniref:Flagellar hook-length control protein FliK n=1 Tax=Marinospirillum insulare TaxID=217169 RepID=A0ABQ5ZWU5_9GAMM|nr:flagellar hook-length control protein FliK [Marinospirillum insulare]GLR63917.1 flagellar hook-length control protein FliK [Marinospirillum insulare]
MNTTARLDFLLGSKASNLQPAPTKPTNPRVEASEFKGQLEKQLHSSKGEVVKPVADKASHSQEELSKKNNKTSSADKTIQAVDRNRHSAPDEKLVVDKESESGESLPISNQARKFLAALPEDDQQQILNEVAEWFASLSPEALEKLKQQLEEDPQQLLASMPPELQAFLAELQQVSLDELSLPGGFSDLLSSLLTADIDFQRVAAIQFQAGAPGELKLLAEAPSSRTSDPLAVAREPAVKASSPLTELADKSSSKEQASDESLNKQAKLNELVSNLGKASAQGVARAGGEALNQLLQAAGMGLGGTQAAGAGTQTVARMAAGFTSMPMMMQAAAESNAQALASRISMMNAKNLQVAEMRLDPPSLGSVRVQIRMQGEQASVVFQAPNAHARELLEQSLPKLREMMEAEGLMLADAQVSEESFSGQDQEKEGSGHFAGSGLSSGEEESAEEMKIPLLPQPLGLIDYYA